MASESALSSHCRTCVTVLALGALVAALTIAATKSQQRPVRGIVPARLAARGDRLPIVIDCREYPVKLLPSGQLTEAVTDEDLLPVLGAALPLWNPPTVPSLLHELKLWGPDVNFSRDVHGCDRTGEFLVGTLLSDMKCKENTTPNGDVYLLDSPYGIRVVLLGGEDGSANRGESHFGQLLMVLAEAGIPSTTPVTTSSGRTGTVAELLQDAIMRFSLSQSELDFVACALAMWLPPAKSWHDAFGNEYTFDQLVAKLIELPYGSGSCGGGHVPIAVATILHVDQEFHLLSEAVRQDAMTWLKGLARLLEQRECAQGGWDTIVPDSTMPAVIWRDGLVDRITVTGHQLEWIAVAPPSVIPNESVITRAVVALRRDVETLPPVPERSFKVLLPVSHAARALCLLDAVDPFTKWCELLGNDGH